MARRKKKKDEEFIPFNTKKWWEIYRETHDSERLEKRDFVLLSLRQLNAEGKLEEEFLEYAEKRFEEEEEFIEEIRELTISLHIKKFNRLQSEKKLMHSLTLPVADRPRLNNNN